MPSFISDIVQQSRHCWPAILSQAGIVVPANHRHGPCPMCGGKDRFRFDDKNGNGTWICNRAKCGHGDGLDLLAKFKGCQLIEAARWISELSELPSTAPARKKASVIQVPIAELVNSLLNQCIKGTSPYLIRKSLAERVFLFPPAYCQKTGNVIFPENTLVLPLVNIAGEYCGAQLIHPDGSKRLLPGSQLKGAFAVVREPDSYDDIIITEGYATGLSLAVISRNSAIYAAISANNLLNVAKALKAQHPQGVFIIAGDNDIDADEENTGKIKAEQAANAIQGKVALPPTDYQADWDDYRKQYGDEATRTAFYHQTGKITGSLSVTRLPTAYSTSLPLRRGSEGFDTHQDYLIKGHLPSNALASIYGPSGSYKSFLAVSWACHIATGKAWAGKRVNRGAVVYVVGEGGLGVPRRIRAWESSLNDNSPIDALYRIDCPVFPASQESAEQVIYAAKDVEQETGLPVRLIVLDTLARCFGGSDENTAKDMGAFIQGCDYIKAKTNATVLVVHHSGKDQDKGARGSSAFRAALDAEFNIRRENDKEALILSCTKMKDADEPPQVAYDLHPVSICIDEDGEEITSLVLSDQPRQPQDAAAGDMALTHVRRLSGNHLALWESIRNRTAQSDSCTKSQVRDDLRAKGIDVSKKFSRWLDKLENDGLLTVLGEDIRINQRHSNMGE